MSEKPDSAPASLIKVERREILKASMAIFTLPIRLAVHARASYAEPQNRTVPNAWDRDQSVSPAALAKELANPNAAENPTIVCVGFHNFYQSAHIPGALFHGPTSTPDGISDLQQFAQNLPRSSNLVIYCGCCPLARCPNVGPAFTALRQMAFTHLRVLALAESFADDWLKAGFPIDKSL